MTNNGFYIIGRILYAATAKGIPELSVEAWDNDLFLDDLVGSSITDENGAFKIVFDETHFRELFTDRKPDLFFKVFKGARFILSTENDLLWNAAAGDIEIVIEIPGSSLANYGHTGEHKHSEHDNHSHEPFFHVPFINPRTLYLIDKAIVRARKNAGWKVYLDETYNNLLQDLGTVDNLANLARRMMLGDRISYSLFVQQLSLCFHQVDKQHHQALEPTQGHQKKLSAFPHMEDEHRHPPHEPTNPHDFPLHLEHLHKDDPRIHLFQTGSLADVCLGIAYAATLNPSFQKDAFETLSNLILPAANTLSNIAAVVGAGQDMEVLLQAIKAALCCYKERHLIVFADELSPLMLLGIITPSAGPTYINIFSLRIVLNNINHSWVEQNPIRLWASYTEEREENAKSFRVEPETVWAGEDVITLIAEESTFHPDNTLDITVCIQGRKCLIEEWQSSHIRVSVPLGTPSGHLYFAKTLSPDNLIKINNVQHAAAVFFPHGWEGSMFKNYNISKLPPIPFAHAKRFIPVKHRPILQEFALYDSRGQLLADTKHQTNTEFIKGPVKVRWKFAPLDDPNATITLIDADKPFGEGLPLAGDLIISNHIIKHIRLKVPWQMPDIEILFPRLVINIPEFLCISENAFAEVHIRLQHPLDVDLTVEIEWHRSIESLPWTGFPILPAGQQDIWLLVRLRPDPALTSTRMFQVRVVFRHSAGERIIEHVRFIDLYLEKPQGQWPSVSGLDMVAIHAALMPTGHVLFFGYDDEENHNTSRGEFQLWDFETRARTQEVQKLTTTNPFCCGHSLLADGRLFLAGGHAPGQRGNPLEDIFDQTHSSGATEHVHIANLTIDSQEPRPRHAVRAIWNSYARMNGGRWYPTCVTLPSGKVLIIGGSVPLVALWYPYITLIPIPVGIDNPYANFDWQRLNTRYAIFDPSSGVVEEPFDDFPTDDEIDDRSQGERNIKEDGKRMAGLYSLMHVLPSLNTDLPSEPDPSAPEGILFVLTEAFVRLYNPGNNTILADSKFDIGGFRTWPTQGSCVLLPIDVTIEGDPSRTIQIMVVGGGRLGRKDNDEGRDEGLDEAVILTYEADAQRFRKTDGALDIQRIRLNRRRFMGDSILLPDGKVLVVNGAERGFTNDNSNRIMQPEIIDPVTGESILMAEARFERGYHSTALLLPDGAVVVAGSTGGWPPKEERFEAEVFEPPYLFCGPRPEFFDGFSDTIIRYGQPFEVESNRDDVMDQIVLIRCGSTTHSLNTDQRMLRFAVVRPDDNPWRLRARMVANRTFAPPGFYMMFLLTVHGTPSKAKIVKVGE